MSLMRLLKLSPPLRRASFAPSGGQGPAPGTAPISIAINKPGPFEPGGQQQLAATAMFPDNSIQNVTGKVRWSSSDEALVNVLPGGLAKVGHGAGTVTITASVNGGKPRDSITVKVQARLQDIVVTPENPLIRSGEIEGLTATAVYEDGSTEDITSRVEWSSNKPKVADFSSPGSCVANEAGTAIVTATDVDAKISGSTRVTVPATGKAPTLQKVTITPLNPDIKLGTQVQFKAMGLFSDKSTHEITARVKWEASDPRMLSISAKGLAKPGLLSGSPLVRATDPDTNLYQSTTVYVEMPSVKGITVSPTDLRVATGESFPVTVTAAFHGGGTMKVNELVQWTPADPRVATVLRGGSRVQGSSEGETTIEVFEPMSGSSDNVSVTVLPPALTSILLFPAGRTIRIGERLRFEATGFFSDGNSRTLARPRWSSSRRDVVDVDQTGEAAARAAGVAIITAEDRATGRSSSVEVKAAP